MLAPSLLLLTACAKESQLAECLDFDKSDTVLIVNVDDVGMHPDYDKAAFSLIDQNKIQTMSLMVPAPNFAVAAKMPKKRDLPVGLHLTLTNEWQEKQPWGAVLPAIKVPSLYNEKGYLWPTSEDVAENAKIEHVKMELKAQIDKALAMGLNVTHIDAHMLVNFQSEALFQTFVEVIEEYQLAAVYQNYRDQEPKMRNITGSLQAAGIVVPDTYYMQYNPEQRAQNSQLAENTYRHQVKSLNPGINHFAIHPSYDTASAREAMADMVLRVSDFNIWGSDSMQQLIKAEGIKTTDFVKMRELKRKDLACLQTKS